MDSMAETATRTREKGGGGFIPDTISCTPGDISINRKYRRKILEWILSRVYLRLALLNQEISIELYMTG